MSWRRAWVWSILVVLAAGSCGPDEENNNIIPANNTSNNTNNTTNNANNTNNSNNTTPTNNVNNTTNNVPGEACEVGVETFADEAYIQIEREFVESTDVEVVSCFETVGEIATNGTYVAELTYSTPTTFRVNASAIAGPNGGIPPRPVVEIRERACGNGESLLCAKDPDLEVEAEANTSYFVIVNGLLSSGGVELTIDSACAPGSQTCAEGVASICRDDSSIRTQACPGACDGDSCLGDACMQPLTIAPEVDGAPVVLEGDRVTFTNTWDAQPKTDCEFYAGQGSPPTTGGEFFVLVEGVQAGQTLVMDAEVSPGRFGFFVIDDCAANACVAAFEFDENSFNVGRYVAPADGDVLVVVEALGADMDREFSLEFSLTGG